MTEAFKRLNQTKEELQKQNIHLLEKVTELELKLRQSSIRQQTQSSPSPSKMDETGVHSLLNAKKPIVPGFDNTLKNVGEEMPEIDRALTLLFEVLVEWCQTCFGSTGEASSVDEYLWLMGRAEYKPIIEYCGGTEIGGSFISGSLLQPQSLAAFSTAVMGCSLHILGDDGFPIASQAWLLCDSGMVSVDAVRRYSAPENSDAASAPSDVPGIGELALSPLMFGASSILLNADHNEIYFKGMPVLYGKVSSLEIERICNAVDENILETAAVGVSSIVPLPSLPRTATNKVMRRVLRQQFSQAAQGSRL
ncbi:hypothetical protein RND71_021617 [Anisodus tanguticus]|uniref:Uncharacterized protein n=1 Tax=Anisodus tanguticus TaxID=243964 RepID=A0AAE1RYE4_9SOLA|nr:hypothetical protein RND71_021617 [Anisodus tanguticus]